MADPGLPGAPISEGDSNLLFGIVFPENCIKLKINGPGVCVPGAPGSATVDDKCVYMLHVTHFAFFNRACIGSSEKTELSVVSDTKNIDEQNPHHEEKLSNEPDVEETKHTLEDSGNKALAVCNDDKEDGEPTSKSTNEKHNGDSDVLLLSDKSTEWTIEKLNKEFRKFNIDLHPRVRRRCTSLLCQ